MRSGKGPKLYVSAHFYRHFVMVRRYERAYHYFSVFSIFKSALYSLNQPDLTKLVVGRSIRDIIAIYCTLYSWLTVRWCGPVPYRGATVLMSLILLNLYWIRLIYDIVFLITPLIGSCTLALKFLKSAKIYCLCQHGFFLLDQTHMVWKILLER